MKAFILSAGQGTRLRPLTYTVPKPMIPIGNKPVLEYTLENSKRCGINDVIINVNENPKMITDYFGDGSSFAMNIIYSYEKDLLGTAGAVKKMEKYFSGTFFVLSGDGLTDIDLRKVLNFHKTKKSFATMVLKKIDARFEYGVTVIDRSSRIKNFLEKPFWSDVFTNTVNTGVYVFEPEIFKFIPKNSFYDFGHQVWPKLLNRGKRIFGYVTDSYWCDIGNLDEYRKGQWKMLEGSMKVAFHGKKIKSGVWVDKGTVVEKGAKLKAPCLIGSGCRIGEKSIVGEYTVIGNNTLIGPETIATNCIIWDNVLIGKKNILNNSIVGSNVHIKESNFILDGATITERSTF
ncbi:MAG: NDP-sugar synthase [bacterium]